MNEEQITAKINEDWADYLDDPKFPLLRDLIRRNYLKGKMLASRGAELDDTSVAYQRLNRFMDAVLKPGSPERIAFEIDWQKFLAENLEKLHAKVNERDRQMQLVRPKQSGLIIPGQ